MLTLSQVISVLSTVNSLLNAALAHLKGIAIVVPIALIYSSIGLT